MEERDEGRRLKSEKARKERGRCPKDESREKCVGCLPVPDASPRVAAV
jgi:hypothetical protein